ncbi:similar to Saccharomyces cerevisiae YBL029C-A Protein of unknown function [Maudiozyma barnettii]|uniref:Zinc-ribbon 15 domain-containing protein n=1 Tax=Maudiozyma barnettii TaxID=61262 RepID=A0A8H2ZG93_9SACH|nr:hypothetical protein [Kazachstania barnettii]CAB4253099.1 similar to Saccharomyces cerevisiae YBL029C-A Protein of unknown function [Kazachstania barnettii]CAD1780366.1 similar to Saccharomyces cerevisiae YBL029C-A Protein of unknown function [Kazachstania barnettii]
MFLFIPLICGTREFNSAYDNKPEHVGLYCPHCHNNSVAAVKSKEFFTFYYIPLVPVHWGKQLRCSICSWKQDFTGDAELDNMTGYQKPQ